MGRRWLHRAWTTCRTGARGPAPWMGAALLLMAWAPAVAQAEEGAAVRLLDASAQLFQTGDTVWELEKSGSVDPATQTVEWSIVALPEATTPGQLVASGQLTVWNTGSVAAPIGNIVVNLQTRQGNQWVTRSSNIANATHGDAATTAKIHKQASAEGKDTFSENSASGSLEFMDATNNTLFSLVPQKSIAPGEIVPLLFQAVFKNTVLNLPAGTQVRVEVIVSFGNSVAGGNASGANIDINGNGTIDAYEARVRSVPSRHTLVVPPQLNGNSTVTLTDTIDDITTTGTVTFSNAMFNLGATSGTVSVNYNGGASGGTITNCAQLTGQTQTVTNGGFTFPLINGVDLEACDTQVIDGGGNGCTPGAPGCGWQDGDVVTYSQASWGGNPATSTAAALLANRFTAMYSGLFQVGIVGSSGFSMSFTSASALLLYLPAFGTSGPLTSNLANPTTSSSGIFGGDVVSLKLNVDFSAAGHLGGSAGLRFGDLRLCSLATSGINGLTVSQLLGVANTLLGGGSASVTIAQLAPVLASLNASFAAGTVSTFAQDHVFSSPCP
jgi:hypothetical protein